jgi:Na+/melibiose symporter-like transporter
MFELFKLMWDAVVLRDAACKGQTNWKMWPIAFGFVLLLYLIGVPAAALYQKNPQDKPIFIAAMVLDGVVFVAMMVWAVRYSRRLRAARRTETLGASSADGRQL